MPLLTNLIRMDHTAVMLAFHQYEIDAPASKKHGIAESICVALEIHAQLEEEILYPATRPLVDRSLMDDRIVPETEEVLQRIAILRTLQPGSGEYDDAFMALMREVIHHVAEEETTLLPAAERQLSGQLGALGARMAKRKLELTAGRAGELAASAWRMTSPRTLLLAAAVLLAGVCAARSLRTTS
jgi:hypothetical protein